MAMQNVCKLTFSRFNIKHLSTEGVQGLHLDINGTEENKVKIVDGDR